MKDYYAILGVNKRATDDDIKKAYRKLARKHHPDANRNDSAAEARFKELNEAYETLSDPTKRSQYEWQQSFGGFGGSGNWPPGAGRAAGHPQSGFPGGSQPGFGAGPTFSGLDDLLQQVFRGSSANQAAPPVRGKNLEATATITLEEAANGATLTVSLTPSGGATRKLSVKVPAGIDTGAKVRVAGEGDPGQNGGKRGDLMVSIQIKPHAHFIREGDDLLVDGQASVFDAVLGGDMTVPTLEGAIKLKIPPMTQGGTVFRLKGKGMPKLKSSERGALRVRLVLRVPEAIAEDDLPLWRQLAGRMGE